jgi:hypothetical protein
VEPFDDLRWFVVPQLFEFLFLVFEVVITEARSRDSLPITLTTFVGPYYILIAVEGKVLEAFFQKEAGGHLAGSEVVARDIGYRVETLFEVLRHRYNPVLREHCYVFVVIKASDDGIRTPVFRPFQHAGDAIVVFECRRHTARHPWLVRLLFGIPQDTSEKVMRKGLGEVGEEDKAYHYSSYRLSEFRSSEQIAAFQFREFYLYLV